MRKQKSILQSAMSVIFGPPTKTTRKSPPKKKALPCPLRAEITQNNKVIKQLSSELLGFELRNAQLEAILLHQKGGAK